MNPNKYNLKRQHYEILLLILTGASHIGIEMFYKSNLSSQENISVPALIFNIAAALLWGFYLLFRIVRCKQVLYDWGFRKDNFFDTIRISSSFGVPIVIIFTIYGLLHHHYPSSTSIILILALYPLWGLIQQFAVQVLINKNLREIGIPLIFRLLIASVLFSVSHYPIFTLMLLVFPLGILTTLIYERYPNIWALGILHGILGTAAYFFILGQDPAKELLSFF